MTAITTAEAIRVWLMCGDKSDAEIARLTRSSRDYVRAVRSRTLRSPCQPGKRGPKPGPRPYRRKVQP